MSLGDWLRNGWLVEHETSPQEIIELLRIADRDLRECQAAGLSPDWRLAIAYNSALGSATAALSAAGYRATRDGHHYRIIQSLAYTIGAGADMIARLDGFRKKRNISDYERSGAVSAHEAKEMLILARMLRKSVGDWLKNNHPNLLQE
ncbi:MAG: hypothetical protein QHH14_08870 [Clostridiales bacterium]|nr:hypothetical protein [Clostridiales bacterium]